MTFRDAFVVAWRKPQPEFVPECTPSFTLEDHIASLRDVDPVKWAALQSEWEGSDRD